MQIATILSDLKSLSVCGHEDALNLVNVPKSTSNLIKEKMAVSEPAVHATALSKSDPDLQRAKDLVELHYTVKLQFLNEGLDAELQKAREDVKRVSRNLASQVTGS